MKAKTILGTLLIAIGGAFIGVYIFTQINQDKEESQVVINSVVPQLEKTSNSLNAAFETPDFTIAAEKSLDAVVHVTSKTFINQRVFSFFTGYENKKETQTSFGSGVIISPDGHIVTNNHVIEDYDEIMVKLNDGRVLSATLIGADPKTDLAVLKVDEDHLPYLPFGNSNELKVGSWVLAVGNPFNLTSTVTAGIVSAKGRNFGDVISDLSDLVGEEIRGYNTSNGLEAFIQTDAAVNRGNSGGALVDLAGNLVGVNTAIYPATSGTYVGYSFAIPSDVVKKVALDLIEYSVVQRPFIGVNIANVTNSLTESEHLKVSEGVYVSSVEDNGAAKEAGIKEGDVIIEVNGNMVKGTGDLHEQIYQYRPGDRINLVVNRNGDQEEFSLMLKNRLGNTKTLTLDELNTFEGATFEVLKKDDLADLGLSSGIRVKDVKEGIFQTAGLRKGFVIYSIKIGRSQGRIDDIDFFRSIVESERYNSFLIEGKWPNGQYDYFHVKK